MAEENADYEKFRPISLNLRIKDWAVFYAKESFPSHEAFTTEGFMDRVRTICNFLVEENEVTLKHGGVGYQEPAGSGFGSERHPQEQEARPVPVPQEQLSSFSRMDSYFVSGNQQG